MSLVSEIWLRGATMFVLLPSAMCSIVTTTPYSMPCVWRDLAKSPGTTLRKKPFVFDGFTAPADAR